MNYPGSAEALSPVSALHSAGSRHERAHVFFALGSVILASLVFLWFQHMVGSGSDQLTSEYTRALAAGHSYLGIKPNPELLALSDPYDPDLNSGVRLLDAALYHGRYYIYYGLTPFITVLVPFFLVTARLLPESQLITGYAIGSNLLIGFLLWDLRRR